MWSELGWCSWAFPTDTTIQCNKCKVWMTASMWCHTIQPLSSAIENEKASITAGHSDCFLLSSLSSDFPLLVDAPLIFILIPQSALSLSLRLVLPAPINTYSSYFIIIVYLLLGYYILHSSSGLSTDVFYIKTNIHTLNGWPKLLFGYYISYLMKLSTLQLKYWKAHHETIN